MPVWHGLTEEMRRAGELQVIGIVQEQHPDRALLYQQWQEFDWPILWDPFNITGSMKVPNVVFIDEYGIVRSTRPSTRDFEEKYMFVDFEAPATPAPPPVEGEMLTQLDNERIGGFDREHFTALSDLLWRRAGKMDAAVALLDRQAREYPDDGPFAFHAGVAHRLRYDSALAHAEDFQAAVDGWTHALDRDPNQYIWRRRIQQYGPRLDKPYPFYTWVEEAQDAIRARGETPPVLVASLTPAELATRNNAPVSAADAASPDPDGKINRDTGLIAVESAVAFQTNNERRTASVHVAFRPAAAKAAHWNNEVEPMKVWFEAPDLPKGWTLDARLLEHPLPETAVSDEVRRFSVELGLPEGVNETTLKGYALFHACEGEEGTCLYLRRDFEVPVRRPRYLRNTKRW